MRIARYLTLLLFLITLPGGLWAQRLKSFSPDPAQFLAELSQFFLDDTRVPKKEAKAELDTFTLFWNSGALDQLQQETVIRLCNTMLKRKMSPGQHFIPYLEAIEGFSGSPTLTDTNFVQWHAVLDKLAQKSQTRFITFIQTTSGLLARNEIYNHSGIIWESSSPDFRFTVENGEPIVHFPSLDLICRNRDDSSIILGTSGYFYPLDEKFLGGKGRVDWERAGYPPGQVYADFDNYELKLKYARYRIDSVRFHNAELFSYPLQGQLVEHVEHVRSPEDASYPQFFSYGSSFSIPGIFPGVDYEGGFSQRGAKMSASGSPEQKATFTFRREGKPFMILRSMNFLVRADRISSQNAEFVMYLEGDSIYHPGLQMRYIAEGKKLSVFRDDEGMGLTPFFNTYHEFDMYIEEIAWAQDSSSVKFKMLEGPGMIGESDFESSNYFSKARFDRILGLETEHPLSVINRYCNAIGTNEFTLQEFSNFMKFDPVQIKVYLLNLAIQGFLVYDLDQDFITVNDRVRRYLRSVSGRVDYDVIRIHSKVMNHANASLDLRSFDLSVFGVYSVLLSDSQQVVIYPLEQKMVIKKNRDMAFAGRVHAGRFDFYGNNFFFTYDRFEISLPVIDSVSFWVRGFEKDADGWSPLRRVTTVIQDVAGSISVDYPDNKSGLQQASEYPIFNCREYAFAYYDKQDIYGGIYPRNTFYYRIDPFVIDSLDNFSTEGLQFTGVFVSAGIFPDIYEKLRVMPDYSLGLVHRVPSGIAAYGGKSRFYNTIRLSDEGLHGNGKLSYASSQSFSKSFDFFPDSSRARLETFDLASTPGKPGFPKVSGEEIAMLYRPYMDRMDLRNILVPFRMYDEFVEHNGELVLRPDRLDGSGTIAVLDAEIDSRGFRFGQTITDADTCDFRLRATYSGYNVGEGDTKGWELMTTNYRAMIDFGKKEGEFRSNGGISNVMFTINQYMSFIDRFDWDMNSDKIELFQEQGSNLAALRGLSEREQVEVELRGPEFISTHPRQDSLRFFAESAVYQRKDNIITAKGVPFIRVADAAIFPSNGIVVIYRKAEMQPLQGARILADVTDKYHLMFDAGVTITGKLSYSGKAKYNYTDMTGLKQVIDMHAVEVNDVLETEAKGSVSDSAGFRLSPWFDFAGKVDLQASEPLLHFDGGARIHHQCDEKQRQWLKFATRIDPVKVAIPVPETPLSTTFGDLYFSFMSTSDSVRVYNAFLDKRLRGSDKKLISSSGFLVYDEGRNEYQVASAERLEDPFNTGNFLSMSTINCNGFASGKMDLGTEFGQVTMDLYGNGEYFAGEDSVQFDLAMILDFFFSKDALEIMTADLAADASLGAANMGSDVYERAILETMGREKSAKYFEDLRLYGNVEKMPEELQKTLILTDIQLHYNTYRRAYISEGPISIASVGKTPIGKAVDGRIEVLRSRSSDEFTLHLELNPGTWYYFQYERGRMMAVSSNPDFNMAIRDTNPDNRRLEVDPGQTPYVFMLTTERSRKSFKRKYGDDDEDE